MLIIQHNCRKASAITIAALETGLKRKAGIVCLQEPHVGQTPISHPGYILYWPETGKQSEKRVCIAIRRDIMALHIIEARSDLVNHPYALVLDIWEMSTKISTKITTKGSERKSERRRQGTSPNPGLSLPTLVGGESPKSGLAHSAAATDKAAAGRRRTRIINIYDNRLGLGTCYQGEAERTWRAIEDIQWQPLLRGRAILLGDFNAHSPMWNLLITQRKDAKSLKIIIEKYNLILNNK